MKKIPRKSDKKGSQRNVKGSNTCGTWSSVWIPDGKAEEMETKSFSADSATSLKLDLLIKYWQISNNN